MRHRLVILESPFAGLTPADVQRNILYARRCVRDSLFRGEAPLASHLLYTQEGILDDNVPEQRVAGIAAGHAWYCDADAAVVYCDHGISPGMEHGIERAKTYGIPVEQRYIGAQGETGNSWMRRQPIGTVAAL